MTGRRSTGPRVADRPSTGPRVATAQPATPPTRVQLGGDRLLAGAREVDIDQLSPDPDQPRSRMHPDRLVELARSIATHGLLQPLVVRADGMGRDGDMRYVIIAGGRRYAAIQLALTQVGEGEARSRLARVPVVLSDSPAAERRVLQLIENLQREDLDPVEEARALKEIMRLENLTTDGVAGRVFRSQGYVDERLRLLRHEEVEDAVMAQVVTKSAGAAIASLATAEERRAWLERARAGEVIRAREIYASKPRRRTRPTIEGLAHESQATSESAGGHARSLEVARRVQALRKDATDLTGPEAHYLATVEAGQGARDAASPPIRATDTAPAGPKFGNLRAGLARLEGILPDGIVRRLADLDPVHPGPIVAAAMEEVPPAARPWVEHFLVLGAALQLSCAETLDHLRPENG